MFRTNLSLLALAFVIAVSSAQMTSYYSNTPVETIEYSNPGYTVVKEVHTVTNTDSSGVQNTYNQVNQQNGWNGNNGGRGNNGGGSGGGFFGGNGGLGGLFNLAGSLAKTTLATGMGLVSGAAGLAMGGTQGASHLANTAVDMVNRS